MCFCDADEETHLEQPQRTCSFRLEKPHTLEDRLLLDHTQSQNMLISELTGNQSEQKKTLTSCYAHLH